jgi:pimeloyl-ACP methyl ester carboxylesterase
VSIADRLHGDTLVVPGAGHYPQAEFPELVSPAVVEFLRLVSHQRDLTEALSTHQ